MSVLSFESLGGLFATTYQEFNNEISPGKDVIDMIDDMNKIYKQLIEDPVNLKFLEGLAKPIPYYASEVADNFNNYSKHDFRWITCIKTVEWYNEIYERELDLDVFKLNLCIPGVICEYQADLLLLLFDNHISLEQKFKYIRNAKTTKKDTTITWRPHCYLRFKEICDTIGIDYWFSNDDSRMNNYVYETHMVYKDKDDKKNHAMIGVEPCVELIREIIKSKQYDLTDKLLYLNLNDDNIGYIIFIMKTKLDQYLLRGYANKTLTCKQIEKILWEVYHATPESNILHLYIVKKYIKTNFIEPLEELVGSVKYLIDDLE
jgi:hypothetical protein